MMLALQFIFILINTALTIVLLLDITEIIPFAYSSICLAVPFLAALALVIMRTSGKHLSASIKRVLTPTHWFFIIIPAACFCYLAIRMIG